MSASNCTPILSTLPKSAMCQLVSTLLLNSPIILFAICKARRRWQNRESRIWSICSALLIDVCNAMRRRDKPPCWKNYKWLGDLFFSWELIQEKIKVICEIKSSCCWSVNKCSLKWTRFGTISYKKKCTKHILRKAYFKLQFHRIAENFHK